ncbi:hypothetical protein Zmor_027028 [Zophobas morio]|uniref:non-specific serine/threonine protein kinase n=2 Tax=Zophobas morio TaxID=2755281 RepID=A0AA38M618_9CUCU|nr:hypothetical protein Zmor_027028 [Zophobas morio]
MSKCMDSKHKHKTHNSKNEMDRYEVIKLLGEGSFGRVYKAKVIADSSFVALKVICKARRSNKEIIGLRRECEIQRNLHHPNIIQMLDSFETASEIVVVTEFAQKELNNLLGKEGYLSEERASPIIWDLVSALFYLHSHRVLHRDLKPQNILIDSTSRAKLCDFGFARNMSTGTHVLTSIKGTPLYMAPELIEEQPYDYKADLWSLGCIMYELLVGAPPFCTASILHLIRLIRHEQIQWPTFVSENCISFLKGLLQKDPVKRITWEEIKNHSFVKGHILICGDSTNMPLTGPLSESTLEVKEQQRKEQLNNRNKSREDKAKDKSIDQFNRRHRARNLSELKQGDSVWVIDLRIYGKIIEVLREPRSYMVETNFGIYRRNRYHLVPAPYYILPPPLISTLPQPQPSENSVNIDSKLMNKSSREVSTNITTGIHNSSDNVVSSPPWSVPPLRRSTRNSKRPAYLKDYVT